MVIALIFAGGAGRRMNSRSKPKQFLEMHGKPIIIYTLEHFEYHETIDRIVVVCIREWMEELKGLLKRFGITKVKAVVPGGETGHDSIYYGLFSMREYCKENDIVLIHDGVRPLITRELITQNVNSVHKYGNAVSVETSRESVVRSVDGENIYDVPSRSQMYVAKAPQSFYFGKINDLYERARRDGRKTIDSAHLCSLYGEPMHMVISAKNNIKITEPADYYIYRALYEAMEGQQIFGL
ncbi:2-C-methyl-D-erythritol 4-phosphate cytidylyltransferase [Dorea sp. 5-2]|nr:2-C-methyl-D-erythritol 4-phosphate cytidylyltransferase [Dorea sp. 5-2]